MFTSHPFAEIVTIELCLSPKNLLLSCVYVPPNCDHAYQSHLFDHISLQSSTSTSDVLFVGDFNAPDINWSTQTASSHFSDSLCSCLSNNNLVQLVNNPTHVQGNILDLAFTNAYDRLCNLQFDNINCSSSDHYLLSLNLNSTRPNLLSSNGSNFTYMYVRADFDGMGQYLLKNQLPNLTQIKEDSWSSLKCLILQARDIFVPKSRIPKKPHPRWFDSTVRHQLNCTCSLRRKSRIHQQ